MPAARIAWPAARLSGRAPLSLHAVTRALAAALPRWIARERDLGRPVLWLAPAMAIGVGAHLVMPADPPLVVLLPLALVGALSAFALRSVPGWSFAGLLAAAMALGVVAVEVSVRRAAGPKIERSFHSPRVVGRVLRVDPRTERAPRALLEVASIEGLAPAATPARLMIVGRTLVGLEVGSAISVSARIAPLPLPTHPGAYDPAFVGYFDRLGGYGFVAARPRAAELPPAVGWTRLAIAVMAWRTEITRRIVDRLGPETGPIAAALVTGQRTAIPEETLQAFNASGLMHVLSISGLHMALVAGGVFWLARALLAAVPFFALRLPIKKIAALLALATATFYEIASGAEVATTRAYVMIAIMFAAILCDRPAVTMRNLVVAAGLILLVMPESARSASFQMSFFATAALVAAVERGLLPRFADSDQPWAIRLLARIGEAVAATVVVSLVCELAILPIQLHHFHRVAWFGVVGNVLAIVVIDLLIMPAAVLALFFVPLGLGDWTLPLLGFGVARMIEIARFVGAFPHAVSHMAGFGALALGASLAGILWACLWRTPIALLGLVPYIAGFALWLAERPPDIRISSTGDLVAIRAADGRLAIDAVGRDDFVARRWLEADGDRRAPDDASLAAPRRCDAAGCTMTLADGLVLALPRTLAALAEDCARADILIARGPVPAHCPRPRLVVDRARINRAHGLTIPRATAPAPIAHAERCGARPWCPDPATPRSRRPFGRQRPAAPQ